MNLMMSINDEVMLLMQLLMRATDADATDAVEAGGY